MEWKYVKPLSSEDLIEEFEHLTKYYFPDDFKKCITSYNGGRPSLKAFDTNSAKERELKSLLSFNKDDKETVWKIYDWNKDDLSDRYIPFAIDNFGNLICFNSDNNEVVYVNHDNLNVEQIAKNFTEFMTGLYE